jgi:hypothetical protein
MAIRMTSSRGRHGEPGDRDRLLQITSLLMVEVIISADDRVPKGRKNLTNHDITRQRPRLDLRLRGKRLVQCQTHHRNLVRLLNTSELMTVCPRVGRAAHKVSGSTKYQPMSHYKPLGVYTEGGCFLALSRVVVFYCCFGLLNPGQHQGYFRVDVGESWGNR